MVTPRTFEFIYMTAEGREYRCTMVSVGDFPDEPPPFVQDHEDMLLAGENLYYDLDRFASAHGCVMKGMESIDSN